MKLIKFLIPIIVVIAVVELSYGPITSYISEYKKQEEMKRNEEEAIYVRAQTYQGPNMGYGIGPR